MTMWLPVAVPTTIHLMWALVSRFAACPRGTAAGAFRHVDS